MNIPLEVIEKDYWVVWTLERLFAIDELKDKLTFKGGTSLSKIYRVIYRFSEDIDLSIEKDLLGFGKPNDPESALSKKKQGKILKKLSGACSEYVQNNMLKILNEAIADKLKTNDGWALFSDQDDPCAQTLLFQYPSKSSKYGYIRPVVKIEMGARSEHWPVKCHKIKSYIKEALKEKIKEPEVFVRVLSAERTFWEKATILHQYAHLPDHKKLPPRLSRHYYDFFCLLNSQINKKSIDQSELLEKVANHKSLYFSSSWASYGTARKGSLKIVPPDRISKELERDYLLMSEMLFREIPEWSVILKGIKEFEDSFNSEMVCIF